MKITFNTENRSIPYREVKVGDCWQYQPGGGPAMKTQSGTTNAVSLSTGNNFYVRPDENVLVLEAELILK